MSDDIKLDLLNQASPEKKTKPTLVEKLYDDRLAQVTETQEVVTVSTDDEHLTEVVELSTLEASAVINQRIGRKSVIDAVTKLLTVTDLINLKKIKETRAYKGSQLFSNGKLVTVTSWEQYCNAVENRSRESVDLELLNLDALGEPLFESMRNVGLGPSTMRAIRKLDSDDRDVIERVAKSSSKDELIDLVDGLVSKHQKEKSELSTQVDELAQDLKDAGKRISNMNAEIERTESELSRLKSKQRLTEFEEQTEAVRDECMHLQFGCELNLDSLDKLFTEHFYGDPTPEQQLRIEQIYVAIKVAASRAFMLLDTAQNLMQNAELHVERIQGQHILNPQEAERWLFDAQMLESKHEAEKLARDVKREASRPKGRGRPAGSKNKAE
ncbi:MAG: hypothetical protein ACO1N8_06265 [Methylophilus sp.]